MTRKAWKDKAFKIFFASASTTAILIVILIFLFLFKEALPFAEKPGLQALLKKNWQPVSFQAESFGLIPLLTGSFLTTILATIIAIPFGVCGSIYISEIARAGEREFLKPFIELLAGIPSVVIGFFGLVALAPFIKTVFGLQSGLIALSGALLLALMAIPTIISISEDAINSVPKTYKEASYALGASKIQTIWKVTVPAAISGITAAVMLGMGRVIGETMVVLMVTGNAGIITLNPFESVRTMTATIAAEMGEVPFHSDHYRALFWVGLVLLVITFSLNLIAQRVFRKYGRRG